MYQLITWFILNKGAYHSAREFWISSIFLPKWILTKNVYHMGLFFPKPKKSFSLFFTGFWKQPPPCFHKLFLGHNTAHTSQYPSLLLYINMIDPNLWTPMIQKLYLHLSIYPHSPIRQSSLPENHLHTRLPVENNHPSPKNNNFQQLQVRKSSNKICRTWLDKEAANWSWSLFPFFSFLFLVACFFLFY